MTNPTALRETFLDELVKTVGMENVIPLIDSYVAQTLNTVLAELLADIADLSKSEVAQVGGNQAGKSDPLWVHRRTGTIYIDLEPGAGGLVTVTTRAGSKYIVPRKNIRRVTDMADERPDTTSDVHISAQSVQNLIQRRIGK